MARNAVAVVLLCWTVSVQSFLVLQGVSRAPQIVKRTAMDLDIIEPGILGDEELDIESMSTMEMKSTLLDTLPRMTGSEEEFRLVEALVNELEARYQPPQTLDFQNLFMAGEWQFLFSTLVPGGMRPNFQIGEMIQSLEPCSLNGTISNEATFFYAEDGTTFDIYGKFTVKSVYRINNGARMVLDPEARKLEITKGSKMPQDSQALLALIFRTMPKQLWNPDDHAMDTTYLDGDLRIVRMTGPQFEGVRDIFIRRGSMEINPLSQRD